MNTWDHSVEKVLKDKFEKEVPKIYGDQPGVIAENERNGSTEKDMESEKRSLMNFLKFRLEIALNQSYKPEVNESA